MKKIQIMFLISILLFLLSCGVQSTTSELIGGTTSGTTSGTDTTSSNNDFVNPFGDLDFIKHLNLSASVVQMIENSTGRIAYLDESMFAYYEEGLSPSSFFVFRNGENFEYDTHQSMGYSDYFIINYDSANDVIYYYDSPYINSIPSVVDAGIDLYASRMRELKYFNSEFLLVGNSFITFKGELLFSDGGTTVFPYQNIGDDLFFYTYLSDITQNQACSIKTYNSFSDSPKITLVHDEFTCSDEYAIKNRNVVIELMDLTTLGGYVTITPDGEIHVMDFDISFPDFDSYVLNSFSAVNEWLIYFQYEDDQGESHHVVTSYDLSYIAIDEMDASIASKNIYVDEDYRLYKYSTTEYRLYKSGVRFYTYTPRSSAFTTVQFAKYGNFGVVYETNTATGDGRMTRINLLDGTVVSYDKPMFSVSFNVSHYMAIRADNTNLLYDISNDEFITIEATGTFKAVNDDYFLIYSDDFVYLFDLENREMIRMNRIGYLRRTLQPYAFLVEHEGEYYLIG